MNAPAPAPPTTSFTDLYVRIQNFYAGQVRHLDGSRAEEFAATFTPDGRFDHAPGEPVLEGRQAIAAAIRAHQERGNATDPVQRRHWFNMLEVFPQDDGTVVTEYYALVVLTRPGVPVPVIAPSCAVRDVLTDEDGELRTLFRRISPDYAS